MKNYLSWLFYINIESINGLLAYIISIYIIVEFKDGEVESDTNPLSDKEINSDYKLKKTKMSFGTALKLSGTNIKTKKGRTLLTAFASSIGIIGIALILSLSNGFDKQIKNFESGTLSTFPIMISQTSAKIDPQMLKDQRNAMLGISTDKNAFPVAKVIYPVQPMTEKVMHTNIFTDKYMKYIESIDPKLVSGLSYTRMLNINLLRQQGDTATMVKTNPMSTVRLVLSLQGCWYSLSTSSLKVQQI